MAKTDGFQLVDMIKQCIEVLMNMKQDESEVEHVSFIESEVRERNMYISMQDKKKAPEKINQLIGSKEIFEKSPASSVQDLQRKLDLVASPSESKQCSTITESSLPAAHREYEKILRQLESECRQHIKCEQQMKLHIEMLTEKMDHLTSQVNTLQRTEQSSQQRITKIQKDYQAVEQRIKERDELVKKLKAEV